VATPAKKRKSGPFFYHGCDQLDVPPQHRKSRKDETCTLLPFLPPRQGPTWMKEIEPFFLSSSATAQAGRIQLRIPFPSLSGASRAPPQRAGRLSPFSLPPAASKNQPNLWLFKGDCSLFLPSFLPCGRRSREGGGLFLRARSGFFFPAGTFLDGKTM